MAVNGRAKGKKFELEIAKDLSAWWNPAEFSRSRKIPADQLPFRRTPNSGAWTRSRQDGVGDIMAPVGYPFVVEAKYQERWEWNPLIFNPGTCLIDTYWKQTTACVVSAKRFPMLVFRKNFVPAMCRFNKATWFEFIKPRLYRPCPISVIIRSMIYVEWETFLRCTRRRDFDSNRPSVKRFISQCDWEKFAV